MVTVSIERTPDSATVPDGAEFTLQAKVEGGTAGSYQWQRDGVNIPDATNAQYTATASAAAVGTFKVTALVDGNPVTAETTISLGPVAVTSPGAEPPPKFHLWFAIVSALVAIGIGVAIFFDLANTTADIVKARLAR